MAAKHTEPVTLISLQKLSQSAPEPQQKGKTIPIPEGTATNQCSTRLSQ